MTRLSPTHPPLRRRVLLGKAWWARYSKPTVDRRSYVSTSMTPPLPQQYSALTSSKTQADGLVSSTTSSLPNEVILLIIRDCITPESCCDRRQARGECADMACLARTNKMFTSFVLQAVGQAVKRVSDERVPVLLELFVLLERLERWAIL